MAAALFAAVLRGPCRRAVRRLPAPPARRDASLPGNALISKVLDGDTVVTNSGMVIRMIGIDTPEAGFPFADRARRETVSLVLGKRLRLRYETERYDRHGRVLAHLFVTRGGKEILVGEHLLRLGYASVYLIPPNLEFAARFRAAQREAVAARRGIWSLPVKPEPYYVAGAFRFHRPDCPHAASIPHPRKVKSRTELLLRGLSPCRYCRP